MSLAQVTVNTNNVCSDKNKSKTAKNIKIIKQAKLDADKQGNNNKKLDSEQEISLFGDILERKGISNAKSLIDNYNSNPEYYEILFERQDKSATSSVDAAIIGALNRNSYVNKSSEIKEEAEDIVKDVYKAVNYKCFFGLFDSTDDDLLRETISKINRDNVMQVLDTQYPNGDMISAIMDDVSQSDFDTYGKNILGALAEKATQQGVDISDILEIEGEDFFVGTEVPGAKIGASATDKKYFKTIVSAIKKKIEDTADIITDKTKAKKDLSATFEAVMKNNDKNRNGYLDGDEIFAFKTWCNKLGITVNEMLVKIKDKKDNAQKLTKAEQALDAVFSSEHSQGTSNNEQKNNKRVTAHINQALIDRDHGKLLQLFENFNKDNVEELLSGINCNAVIGNILVNTFDDGADVLNEKIISALYAKAVENDIDVNDIIKQNQDGDFSIGRSVGSSRSNVLDKKYVNVVIQKLRQRIKEEIGK